MLYICIYARPYRSSITAVYVTQGIFKTMEKPSSKPIEVTVISAEGLMVNRKQPVKKNVFVVVRADPFNSRSTAVDQDGGSYPRWNEKLEMELPLHVRYMTVEVHSGSKLIGTASIPVTDFSGGYLPEYYLSFLSYRLRKGNGEKNGIVNLSVKVKGTVGRPWAASPAPGGCAKSSWMGVSVDGKGWAASTAARGCAKSPWMGVSVDGKGSSSHGIVTGIPVSYRYSR